MEKGLVIKSTGSWYTVRTIDGTYLDCKIKGKFRIKGIRSTNPVSVGDWVIFTRKTEDNSAVINEICDRKNYIIRKSPNLSRYSQVIAANVDQAFLIITVAFPETSFEFVDRFLVSAEAYRIPVVIIINKIDLYGKEIQERMNEFISVYEAIGYPCLKTSATERINIDLFRNALKNRVNVISGKSGVGKSSLVNAVDPQLKLKTKEISNYHLLGKHTTTFSEMHELAFNGYIIDTPGIKAFGMIDMDREEIYHFFPEIFRLSENCQYYNCLHIHEPNCAVKAGLSNGRISASRYKSYLSLLDNRNQKYRR